MSLADAFLYRLRQEAESRTKRRLQKGVGVDVLPVVGKRVIFMTEYLSKLYEQKKGTFCKPKTFARQIIYECERSNTCKGTSSGDPTKTRANGCSAYVSFMFEEGATITACIVRYRLTHNGHDLANREQSKVNRIDNKLKVIIENNINRGMKTNEVLADISRWNKVRGNIDHKDRRFFPSRQDIMQLALSMKKPAKPAIVANSDLKNTKKRNDKEMNTDGLSRLVKSELRDSCIFYQSRTTTGNNPRPLIIVLQNPDQRRTFSLNGHQVVFMDKNYDGLCEYGSAVYVLVVLDNEENPLPVAYIITSTDDGQVLGQALKKIKTKCPEVIPKAFFIDSELRHFATIINSVYKESEIFIPWYQIIQKVHSWLMISPVKEKQHADVRKILLQNLLELKKSLSKTLFDLTVSEMNKQIEFDDFTDMLQIEWLSCSSKWCQYGRTSILDNISFDKVFMKIKYQFLKGFQNKRAVEELVRVIADNITEYRNFVIGLLNMCVVLEGTAGEQAMSLLQQGWSMLVTWEDRWCADVPCHNTPDTFYRVNLTTMECQCTKQSLLGMCVHLYLLFTISQTRDGPTPEQERYRLASEAFENSDFIMDDDSCITLHCKSICVTQIDNRKCTCPASDLNVECVGMILLKIAEGIEEAVTYSVPSINKPDTIEPQIIECNDNDDELDIDSYTDDMKCANSLENLDKSINISTTLDISDSIPVTTSISEINFPIECVFDQSYEESNTEGSTSISKIEKPVLIQTTTGINNKEYFTSHIFNEKLEKPICKQEESSRYLIEQLYKWSQSSAYKDSEEIHSLLQQASLHMTDITLTNNTSHQKLSVKVATQKRKPNNSMPLNIICSSSKRPKNTGATSYKDEIEMELEQEKSPQNIKFSRSGRTLKIKEEPDFVS